MGENGESKGEGRRRLRSWGCGFPIASY